ncbi:MAG: hypothetical protein J6X62_05175 [Bacteroidales bacterium]|nr:hypothetical protein [Bacteroidales bacterium]
MKKTVFILMLMLAVAMAANAQTRDCRQIVLPHVGFNQSHLNMMSEEKLQWHCTYSEQSFFETDALPAGAVVYDISVLVDLRTGDNVSSSFVVNLTTLSYYAYNFGDFQGLNGDMTIYFRTPSSRHAYLGVYSAQEAFERTERALSH